MKNLSHSIRKDIFGVSKGIAPKEKFAPNDNYDFLFFSAHLCMCLKNKGNQINLDESINTAIKYLIEALKRHDLLLIGHTHFGDSDKLWNAFEVEVRNSWYGYYDNENETGYSFIIVNSFYSYKCFIEEQLINIRNMRQGDIKLIVPLKYEDLLKNNLGVSL
jgi:hypothetical protein